MKNALALVGTLALCVSLCSAAQTPESIRFSGAEGFQKLAQFKPLALKTSQYVRLSGNVTLNGSTHVPQNSHYAYVTLSGWTNITGGDRYQSGTTNVSQSVSIWLNGNYVSQWVQVNVHVNIYKDGRYVGSTYVQGSVHVSGWNNNGWVNLSGSGTLTGDILAEQN
ncbi:MAG: hypothetical protein HY922_07725 [Elusimicrobia bacterium]|nr:hypothetical protein [Elusimicrobiota bacterium]